jgi:hypothetical protein
MIIECRLTVVINVGETRSDPQFAAYRVMRCRIGDDEHASRSGSARAENRKSLTRQP